MTRPDLTDITLVLDRSGSMAAVKDATIEAFNGFVVSQRQGSGTAQMTLVQFDDRMDVVYEARPIAQAPELTSETFEPRASTALLDAMGRTIIATGRRLSQLPEHERPGTVVFVTLTDGQENSSHEYSLQRINEMIAEQRDKYSWQFVFLAANQDAIATAASMGIDRDQALTMAATPSGMHGTMGALNSKLHKARSDRAAGVAYSPVAFDDEDRAAAAGK